MRAAEWWCTSSVGCADTFSSRRRLGGISAGQSGKLPHRSVFIQGEGFGQLCAAKQCARRRIGAGRRQNSPSPWRGGAGGEPAGSPPAPRNLYHRTHKRRCKPKADFEAPSGRRNRQQGELFALRRKSCPLPGAISGYRKADRQAQGAQPPTGKRKERSPRQASARGAAPQQASGNGLSPPTGRRR